MRFKEKKKRKNIEKAYYQIFKMKILIKIRNVNVSYSKERKIFKDINLDIIKQDFILINGENGCGKSSFLKLLYMQKKSISS